MFRARRRKEEKAFIGIVLIILGMVWLSTGNTSLVISLLIVFVAILLSIGIYLNIRKKKKMMASGIADVDEMDGRMFEQLLLKHFHKLGYKAKVTSDYADYGADLLLVKDNTKYVVQAKRWKQKVGVKAIQEAVASIKHYKADRGIVITNSFFTSNARELAKSNGIELWDRDKLIDTMSRVQGKELTEKVTKDKFQIGAVEICPRCGSKLMVKTGKRDQFIGCTGFPRCRYSQDY